MQLKIILVFILIISIPLHARSQEKDVRSGFYTNPIFAGDYPDPSILVEGEDYYLVHSSFEYYPGLLIWHSRDLINWTPVTTALNRYVGSVWAPELVKYRNRYFIYFPASNTNYVVWADRIEGPWSDPVELDIPLIDPGHVVDEKGKPYLYFSSGSFVPLSDDGLSIAGEVKHSYDGWEIPREWSIECFCMEGPKLFKRGDYYYLTVAEGGTAGPPTGHMVISARSQSPFGPWENSPYNPVLRSLDKSETWWSAGHATIFETAAGQWQMIFHAYEKDYYTMGRQTLLLPVEWTEEGWFRLPGNTATDQPLPLPLPEQPVAGFKISDSFGGNRPGPQWRFYGEYDPKRFEVRDNCITLRGKGSSVADCSPMLTIPADHSYTVEVELETVGNTTGGLVLFYNERAYSGILADGRDILANLRGWQFPAEKGVVQGPVYLRLRNIQHTVDMYYSADGKNWIKIENSFEASAYHHNVLSGFMSLRIGLCSIGEGQVKFRNFRYEPVYNPEPGLSESRAVCRPSR